jgi:hypothetical protein
MYLKGSTSVAVILLGNSTLGEVLAEEGRVIGVVSAHAASSWPYVGAVE